LTWYVDSDGDGYGDGSVSTDSCFQPPGYIDLQGDCNDSDGDFHPGATEICDSLDNDCNGIIDDDLSLVGTDQSCPGQDCQDLMVNFGVTDDGNYWIDPDETGTFEIFCDMSNLAGGWTLVANVDDVNDPYFGALQSQPWEGNNVRNESVLPSYTSDISVSTKYASWSNIDATDVYIRYKNSNNYFLCEGLSVVDSLDQLFSITPSSGTCSSECTSYSEDIMPESTSNPVGLNCSDGNEGWIGSSGAENARIGGRSIDNSCCVMNAWLGAAGDRGYSTSIFEKTWGAYSSGAVYDNNIMVFVR
jgi:hypothetical protein